MIGVKRPFKLGAPKPPKSAKKKKALKETQPRPDPDDATVVENPYTESMPQKPSDLMQENPPVTEVLEEGYAPNADEMVQHLPSETKGLECPETLPHLMRFRYYRLLEKCPANEIKKDHPPSLSWLEERYGHLVEKPFWYDRTVKLTSLFHERCEGDVFDLSQFELEKAVGRWLPFTEEEQEYLQLLDNYKKSPIQIDGIPTLEYLRQHHAKPPQAEGSTPPEYHPEEAESPRYVPYDHCPIHEDSEMTCLNADEVYGPLFFKCTQEGCSVFYTSDTSEDVRHQLQTEIHPTVHEGLFHADLKCHCDFTPRMKLSRSEKNPGRVFLSCCKKTKPCGYFQWVHWKVRPPQRPMDAYVQTWIPLYRNHPGDACITPDLSVSHWSKPV